MTRLQLGLLISQNALASRRLISTDRPSRYRGAKCKCYKNAANLHLADCARMSAGRGAVPELGTGSSDPAFAGSESLGQS
jgi:hypothetical protein